MLYYPASENNNEADQTVMGSWLICAFVFPLWHTLTASQADTQSLYCRCGSVQPGDKLLCINDIRTENLSIDEAVTLLKGDDEIIKLKLKRDDPCTGEY